MFEETDSLSQDGKIFYILYSVQHMEYDIYILYSVQHMEYAIYILYSVQHMEYAIYILYSVQHMEYDIYILYSVQHMEYARHNLIFHLHHSSCVQIPCTCLIRKVLIRIYPVKCL